MRSPRPRIQDLSPRLLLAKGLSRIGPGGFHPVILGDVVHERYRVIRKLGYGSYATVWLVFGCYVSHFSLYTIYLGST
jgi:hypothetical protein